MSALPSHPLHSTADIEPPDWKTARILWEQGVQSQQDIANRIGVNLSTLQAKAKRHGWPRDRSHEVKTRAQSVMDRPPGAARVLAAVAGPGVLAPEDERAAIDMGAQAIVQVRLGHRRDIARARSMLSSLMQELEAVQHGPEVFAQVQMWVDSLDPLEVVPADLLRKAIELVVSLPQRARVAKDLVDTLKSVVGMEREAFGLDTSDGTRPVVIIKDYTGKGSAESPPLDPEVLDAGTDGAYAPRVNQDDPTSIQAHPEPQEDPPAARVPAKPGPKPRGDAPMTHAQRQKLYKERKRKERLEREAQATKDGTS